MFLSMKDSKIIFKKNIENLYNVNLKESKSLLLKKDILTFAQSQVQVILNNTTKTHIETIQILNNMFYFNQSISIDFNIKGFKESFVRLHELSLRNIISKYTTNVNYFEKNKELIIKNFLYDKFASCEFRNKIRSIFKDKYSIEISSPLLHAVRLSFSRNDRVKISKDRLNKLKLEQKNISEANLMALDTSYIEAGFFNMFTKFIEEKRDSSLLEFNEFCEIVLKRASFYLKKVEGIYYGYICVTGSHQRLLVCQGDSFYSMTTNSLFKEKSDSEALVFLPYLSSFIEAIEKKEAAEKFIYMLEELIRVSPMVIQDVLLLISKDLK